MKTYNEIIAAMVCSKRIFIVGNGGSCSNALHFESDLREMGFNADALTNLANLTAIGNDFGYKKVFTKQLESKVLEEDDMVICISGSGNSKNILEVIKLAKKVNTTVVVVTSSKQGKLRNHGLFKILIDTKDMEDFETETLAEFHQIKKQIRKWMKKTLQKK